MVIYSKIWIFLWQWDWTASPIPVPYHRLGIDLRLGQFLQGLPLAAHQVVARLSREIEAPQAKVKLQGRFVPVQDGEVELVAASGQAQLEDSSGKSGKKTFIMPNNPQKTQLNASVFREEMFTS